MSWFGRKKGIKKKKKLKPEQYPMLHWLLQVVTHAAIHPISTPLILNKALLGPIAAGFSQKTDYTLNGSLASHRALIETNDYSHPHHH